MTSSKRLEKLRDAMANTIVVPNVRDAVRGLPPESDLSGPVEFYGERSLVLPAQAAVRKDARNQKERRNMDTHFQFLKDVGVGPEQVFDIPAKRSQDAGVVDRMRHSLPERISSLVGSPCEMNFFINTPEAEELARNMGMDYIGPDPFSSGKYNNKVFQRMLMANMNGDIFPCNRVIHSEEEAEEAYRSIAKRGSEVVGKVGYLASGEGMEVIHSRGEAKEFYRKWSASICPEQKSGIVSSNLFMEEKKPLREGVNSASVQFLLDRGSIYYIGPSVQMVKDDFLHAGNRTGLDIPTCLEPWIEKEMIRKSKEFIARGMSELMGLKSSIIGFDFIVTREEQVLMVECNFRCTASTLLFGLEAQLGSHLSYELAKHRFPQPLKYDFPGFAEVLKEMNTANRAVIPLDPRLFDRTGEIFLAVAAPTFDEIDEIKQKLYNRNE